MIAALILAAGASTRFGSPKQLARLRDETLLDRAVRTAGQAELSPIIVVLGAHAQEIRSVCHLSSAHVVLNPAWESGMASSIHCGMEALALHSHPVAGCIVMTCDMPAVTAEHLRRLANHKEIVASGYAGRRGVPAFFPASIFHALAILEGDLGARELIQAAPAVDLPHGDLDIDTVESWQRASALFG